jgi:hypothetical protein
VGGATVEKIAGGLKVLDPNGQSLAYVYSRETKDAANIAKVLTEDEARRIASNIAKQLGKVRPDDNIQAVGNLSDERHDPWFWEASHWAGAAYAITRG